MSNFKRVTESDARPYEAPVVKVLGAFTALTLGGGGQDTDMCTTTSNPAGGPGQFGASSGFLAPQKR